MPNDKRSSFIQFALIFLIVYLGTQALMELWAPEKDAEEVAQKSVELRMVDKTVKDGHHPEVIFKNNTNQILNPPDTCPLPPVDVYKVVGEERVRLTTDKTALPCEQISSIQAGDKVTYSLAPWKYSLFSEHATYELALSVGGDTITTQFSIYEAGTITQVFRSFITKPLLNGLVFIASLLPNYSLGFAVIILTLIVKLILFIPTQHALEGQKKMQAIQPKIDELRSKYKQDPKKLNEETMKLWKKEKVNPVQSCMPMLLQFPLLIGLFFVIRDGSVLELSQHLLYSTYADLEWTFGTQFFGFELTQPSIYVAPVVLVVLQFIQMKLSFSIADKKKNASSKEDVVDITPKKKKKKQEDTMASAMQTQQKVMMYGLPLMIGIFAVQFPAAVSLYWAVSTVFAIGQQIVVNREHLT